MTKTPLFKYTGNNGVIITPIDLGIEHENMFRLSADIGHVLTDGEVDVCVVDVLPEDESRWTEKEYVLPPDEAAAVEHNSMEADEE